MRQGILVIVAALAAALAAASAERDNVATMQKQCALVQKMMTGKAYDAELMKKFMAEFSEMYAPRISCSGVPNSEFRYSLKNATMEECTAADPASKSMITMLDMPCDAIAPVAGTDGKQVVWDTDMTGQFPSGEKFKSALVVKFTFGNDGKIVATDKTYDTAPLINQNMATLKEQCAVAKKMASGKVWDPELMKKLLAEFSQTYAPRISCSAVPGSDMGYSLKNATMEECAAADTQISGGYKVLDYPCEGFAPVAGTAGKQVLWDATFTVQNPAGKTFKAACALKYTFGSDGKIVAYDKVFDTFLFRDLVRAAEEPREPASLPVVFALGCAAGAAVVLGAMGRRRQRPRGLLEGYEECAA